MDHCYVITAISMVAVWLMPVVIILGVASYQERRRRGK